MSEERKRKFGYLSHRRMSVLAALRERVRGLGEQSVCELNTHEIYIIHDAVVYGSARATPKCVLNGTCRLYRTQENGF